MSGVARTSHQFHRAPAPASVRELAVADWQRMRGTWMLPLTVLGPLGVTALGVFDFLLRHKYLLAPYLAGKATGFGVVMNALGMMQVLALGLGAALLASMIVDVEHRSDTWKQFLSLPVSRRTVYVVKFAWVACLLAVSSALMSLGYAALMTWQHLGPIPWRDLANAAALPWVAVLPLLALQLLLSSTMCNQALPLTLGIAAPMFGLGMSPMPVWLPWRLPSQALVSVIGGVISGGPGERLTWLGPQQIVAISVAWVIPLVVVGALLLARREIR